MALSISTLPLALLSLMTLMLAVQVTAHHPYSRATVDSTAVLSTTGLGVGNGSTIYLEEEGLTDSSTTGEYKVENTKSSTVSPFSSATDDEKDGVIIPEGRHEDLRKRQQVENPSTNDDDQSNPIQVSNSPTYVVPENRPTLIDSSTAIPGQSSPVPSSYTSMGGNSTVPTTGTTEEVPTVTRTSEVTGHDGSRTSTVTTTLSLATLRGTETGLATSTVGLEGGVGRRSGVERDVMCIVVGVGFLVALGGIFGM